MPGLLPKHAYSRRDVCRLLGLSARQLRSWERQGFVPSSTSYGFNDLIALRTLTRLRASRVSTRRIRKALEALRQKLHDVGNPLTELRLYAEGDQILVQAGGQRMEPLSGQLLLDFSEVELNPVPLQERQQTPNPQETRRRRRMADDYFQRAMEIEQTGAALQEAIDAYRQALEHDPEFAAALVNLGTIHFGLHEWDEAERYYRKALEVNPLYTLAHFNLGNLFDEKGDLGRAIFYYRAALQLDESYADAHYNLALLFQSTGQNLAAMRHWKAYLRLDRSSPWAQIAKRELDRLYSATVVRGQGPQAQKHKEAGNS